MIQEYKDNIFLDDERDPWMVNWMTIDYSKISWRIVRNYNSFVLAVSDHFPKAISFDNDLQTIEEGYDCLKWLIDYCLDNNLKLPKILIHSQNTVAKENIESLVRNFNKNNGEAN